MTQSQTHISNTHLPRLPDNRLDQMIALACSHAQDNIQTTSLLQRVNGFITAHLQAFAGAGMATATAACLAVIVLLPHQTPSGIISGTSDISYSEDTISEYIIQDFLDEMAS